MMPMNVTKAPPFWQDEAWNRAAAQMTAELSVIVHAVLPYSRSKKAVISQKLEKEFEELKQAKQFKPIKPVAIPPIKSGSKSLLPEL